MKLLKENKQKKTTWHLVNKFNAEKRIENNHYKIKKEAKGHHDTDFQ